jgi:hypothetical protein
MRLDCSEHRIIVTPENEWDEAYMQRLFQGSRPPQASLRRGAIVLDGTPRKPRERTPGDLPLLSRLQDRAAAR